MKIFLHLLTLKTAGHWATFQIQFSGTFNQSFLFLGLLRCVFTLFCGFSSFLPQPVAISSIHPHRNRGGSVDSLQIMILAPFCFSFHSGYSQALMCMGCKGVGHLEGRVNRPSRFIGESSVSWWEDLVWKPTTENNILYFHAGTCPFLLNPTFLFWVLLP